MSPWPFPPTTSSTCWFAPKAAFAPVTSANQIALEAFGGDSVDVDLFGPPGAEDAFVVHARLRRLADGAVSDVVSVPAQLDPTETVRTEWVGCSAGAPVPSAFALGAILMAAARRRRQR